ncbi:serine/arginine-rich splicing factor SC35 [Cocos nucifera]|uniref:Serine/arginine-rich splicing factor SC35 n=1 Tax=Cocos nucifera TaxID=13894 RepID=A0A8K0I8G9_COCNU|nr:serine/arginine-rich splicing factor SC35 [Cocos nucifera]
MSHFGRSGPPDIRDTYSLLVLNISFRTTADDLYPLFDRYGKVVDVFIPRDRSHKGRIVEVLPRTRGRSRSRSPRPSVSTWIGCVGVKANCGPTLPLYLLTQPYLKLNLCLVGFVWVGLDESVRYRDDYRDRDYRRRSRSRSRGRYDRYDRYRDRERDYRRRSRSRSESPDYYRGRGRRSDDDRRRSRSRSYDSASPDRHSYSPRRSPTPRRTPPSHDESPDKRSHGERSPPSRSVSPRGRHADSRSPSPRSSDQD